MIKCKNCRWWLESQKTDMLFLYPCDHPKVDTEYSDAFGVANGEPFNQGTFATGPEFGCIHGEAKKENNNENNDNQTIYNS